MKFERHKYATRILWVLFTIVYTYFGLTSQNRNTRENFLIFSVMAFGFFTINGYSERKEMPYGIALPNMLKGFTMPYAIVVMALCLFNYEDAKYLWNLFDPESPPEIRSKFFATWQVNCNITWQTVYNKMDRYSAAHFIGWIVHALLIRDYYVMHMWSFGTELIELLLGKVIPPLAECWWDQLLCDVAFTNIPGMIIGMWIIRKVGWEEFDWLGRRGAKSILEWDFWTNHKRILGLGTLLFVYAIQFLGCFFVQNVFHTSPTSNWSGVRLLIWTAAGNATFKEIYMYATEDPKEGTRLGGHFLSIGLTLMYSEFLIVYKFYQRSVITFNGSLDPLQVLLWQIGLGAYLLLYAFSWTKINQPRQLLKLKDN